MTAWLAVIISVLGLILNTIKEKDKYLSYFDGLKARLAERAEREKALAFVAKLTNPDSKQQPSLLAFYIPVFLISIISSAALSYLGRQPQFYNTILLSTGVYLSISMIVLVTFLATSRRFEWRSITALFVGVLTVSALWGIFVILVEKTGLGIIWSGIIAGGAVILFLLEADLRSSRRSSKQRAK